MPNTTPIRPPRIVLAAAAAWTLAASCSWAAEDLGVLEQKAFRAAVDRVAPSVVRIETIGGLDRVGKMLIGTGPTTGLIVAADGYIISSAFNFINRPASILVQLPDGTRKVGQLVATDHNRMVALLKIDADKLPLPEIAAESEIRVGQWAVAVGRTFEGNQPNMAVGVISALRRIWGKAIQTDAAVSPNNYGGPLLDVRGRVLGVLVPLSPQDHSETAGYEWYDSGIGFAIPLETIQQLLPRLKQGKDLMPGVIGVQFAGAGVMLGEPVLANCRPRSPAHRAGLKAGDRVVEIEGKKITLASQIKQELARRYAGDKLRLAVLRNGQRSEHEVELVAKLQPYQHPFLGVLPVRGTKPQTAEAKPAAKAETPPKAAAAVGVPVRFVYPDSPAAKVHIAPGDVLVSLAGSPLHDPNDLRNRLADCEPGQTVAIEFRRDGAVQKVEIQLAAIPEQIPPDNLPPPRPAAKPGQAGGTAVGPVEFKLADFQNNPVHGYVPETYDPTVPHGLVLWLHGPGGLKEQELLTRWKPVCDRWDLILLAPKAAEGGKWQPREVVMLQRLVAHALSTYTVDPLRVVVAAEEGAGLPAFGLAFADRAHVRGVLALDAALAGRLPENEPGQRLAVLIARGANSRSASTVKQAIDQLREMKYPVTVKDLGPSPRPLTPAELDEAARWIDALDRI